MSWLWALAGISLGALLTRLLTRRSPPSLPAAQNEKPIVAQQNDEATRQLATLRAVVDNMSEGLWITNEDGVIQQHNDALKEMLYAGTAIVGHSAHEVTRSNELADAVRRACKEGHTSRLELSVEGVRPRTLAVHVAPLGRELKGSSAVFFDVTDLRRLEKVRKDFVANVSHELRTPITAIRGYAETLQGGVREESQRQKMVEIIHRQSERLSELVEDLLELSRLENQQLQLAEIPVELSAAALRAAETVKPKANARNVEVVLEVQPGLTALGDQRAVEQVLLNLLDNAVKYTPTGGKVQVLARAGATAITVAVKDTGMGIEPRHLARIFERFYRVDKGRSREMGGTGLGLSIVKHLVGAMNGDVRVESTPGQGSTFFVELPFSPQPSPVSEPPNGQATHPPVQ